MTPQSSADLMLRAVESDPQFRPPQRPRLLPGLTMVPVPNGLLFEGAHERQLLKGRSAIDFLPQLVQHLDGTKTTADVVEALSAQAHERNTRAALALLYTSGLLEDAADDEEVADTTRADEELDPHVLAFASRMLDVTRAHRSGRAMARALARARLAVVGEERLAAMVAGELRTSGITQVVADHDTIDRLDHDSIDLLIVADTTSTNWAAEIHRRLAGRPLPWLRVVAGPTIEIGPRFDQGASGHTGCFGCLNQIVGIVNGTRGAAEPHDDVLAITASIAALEAANIVGRVSDPMTLRTVIALDATTLEQASWLAPRLPDCAGTCDPDEGLRSLSAAYLFEQAVAFPPRSETSPKAHQVHYKPSNLDLQGEHRTYPSAPSVHLPVVDHASLLSPPLWTQPDHERTGDSTQPGLDVLACLLETVVGLKPVQPASGTVARFAPTGGNLGSASAWVSGPMWGADPAVYFHQPFERRLQRVAPWDDTVASRLAEIGCCLESDETLVVLSAAVGKVAHKYGDFAYRVSHLDAGVALAQALAVTTALGLDMRLFPAFDEVGLASILGLTGQQESLTAAFAVRPTTTARGA